MTDTPLNCYHCALPVPADSHFRATILGAQRPFCCPGCQAVAEAIVASGLEHYYQHRSDPGAQPDALPQHPSDELALLDRPEVQQRFVQYQGDLATTTLWIDGISCAACGWLIERHLRSLPAVADAALNLTSQRLYLRWDAQQLPLSHVIETLRRIGYAAHPYQADEAATRLAAANRTAVRRLGVAGLLWVQAMMASMATWPEFNLDLSLAMHSVLRWVAVLLSTPIVFYSCAPFFLGAARDLRTRHLTMDTSVALAIGLAYAAGLWSALSGRGELYLDAVGMFALLLLSGRYLEQRARQRSATATSRLLNLLPASCLRMTAGGGTQRILLDELRPGDRVQVLPGAQVPADGCIVAGHSWVDESLLTGEYRPQPRGPGDPITGGTLNGDGPLQVRVEAVGPASRLSAIVRLLERAQEEKPRLAQLADRAAHLFLLCSLVAAVTIGLAWWLVDPERAFWVVLAMLVATCPCALSLATPTVLAAATGTLHGAGVLVTRGHVLEGLHGIDTVVFDKTGTLTQGRSTLHSVVPLGAYDEARCLALAAALEHHSEHPLARAFGPAMQTAEGVRNHPGAGLEGVVDGQRLRLGQAAFVCALGRYPVPPCPPRTSQWLLLGDAQGPLAWFGVDDTLRADAADLVRACQARGWRTLLLSGDPSPMVADVARRTGIEEAIGGLLPEQKLQHLKALQAEGRRVLMVGDGINDVPVLAGADISVAMGAGTDLAKRSADVVLLNDRLGSLAQALDVAQRTRRVVVQNLAWASLYNAVALPFAAAGCVTPAWAALGMSLSSLAVVLNALRLTRAAPASTTPSPSPLPTAA